VPRGLKREVRVSWILTAIFAAGWLVLLISTPDDTDGLIGLGAFTALMVLSSWHHAHQVKQGRQPWGVPPEKLRPFPIVLIAAALVVLMVLLAMNLAAPQTSPGFVLASFLPPLLVAVALIYIYWLRK
jgi:hypothetical protein